MDGPARITPAVRAEGEAAAAGRALINALRGDRSLSRDLLIAPRHNSPAVSRYMCAGPGGAGAPRFCARRTGLPSE